MPNTASIANLTFYRGPESTEDGVDKIYFIQDGEAAACVSRLGVLACVNEL